MISILGLLALGLLYTATILSPLKVLSPKLFNNKTSELVQNLSGISGLIIVIFHALASFHLIQKTGIIGLCISLTALVISSVLVTNKLKNIAWFRIATYVAGFFITVHVLTLGSHFKTLWSPLPQMFFICLVILILLEARRIDLLYISKFNIQKKVGPVLTASVILLGFWSYLHFSTPAYAHFVMSDGPITTIIHIDPNDNPSAGEIAKIFFEFKDTENKFNQNNCECVVTILHNHKPIRSEVLKNPVFFTFPEIGVYTIEITGTPKSTASFRPFTLHHDLRIESESKASHVQHNETHTTQTMILSSASLFIIGLYINERFKNKNELNQKK